MVPENQRYLGFYIGITSLQLELLRLAAQIFGKSQFVAARKVAAVLQEQPTDFALTVREIVTLGRTPHHVEALAHEAMARKIVI